MTNSSSPLTYCHTVNHRHPKGALIPITLDVDGKRLEADVDPSTPLLWALRDALGLTGTKYGCGMAQCGACTGHLDGRQSAHATGDFPRQGDDSHAHSQNVKRGPFGHGVTSQKCAACHQTENVAGLNMPPGAPNWHLPPQYADDLGRKNSG